MNTTYEPLAGTSIGQAAFDASSLSKKIKRVVRFDFNTVSLFAAPKKSSSTILWEFENILAQQHERYRLSKKGQQARIEREREISKRQDAVCAAVKSLPGLLEINNLDQLMGWLNSFTVDADDVGVDIDKACNVKEGGWEWLAILFEAKGYKQNHHVGNSPEWVSNRERMGQYIIGQAINFFRNNMPPHPMTTSFVQRYFKLPK